MTSRNISSVIWATFLTLLLVHPIDRASAADEIKALLKDYVVYGPKPVYPYAARARRQEGFGVAVIKVDRATGKVVEAVMAESTGVRILDDAAVETFRRWKFKPGTISKAMIPITFTIEDSGSGEVRVEKARPMDDVLAPFLGKGTVVNGPIPRYPSFPPWSFKEGSGVYELHVNKEGKVAEVKILRSSGDATFDREAVSTLRKWRLRKGPLVIELPLAFKLTPESFRVRIP